MSVEQYATFPEELTLREVRIRVPQKGFRTKSIVVVTTLLDADKYPPAEIALLYRRRWQACHSGRESLLIRYATAQRRSLNIPFLAARQPRCQSTPHGRFCAAGFPCTRLTPRLTWQTFLRSPTSGFPPSAACGRNQRELKTCAHAARMLRRKTLNKGLCRFSGRGNCPLNRSVGYCASQLGASPSPVFSPSRSQLRLNRAIRPPPPSKKR